MAEPDRSMNELELLEGLLKIYSPSYQEHAAVEYLVARMNELGLRAFCDEAGSAVGIVEPPSMRPDDALTNAIRVWAHRPLAVSARGINVPLPADERG